MKHSTGTRGIKILPIHSVWKALRPQQWVKNLLVFLPVISGHEFGDLAIDLNASIGAVAFCGVASAGYLLNDLVDIHADRAHPNKRERPFASGTLPLKYGVTMIPALILLAAALAFYLPSGFSWVLAGYLALTALYTFKVKRMKMLDVVFLSTFYTARIIAGSEATGIPLTVWTLTFSTLFFTSLAFTKRYIEIAGWAKMRPLPAGNRGYRAQDLDRVKILGIASGLIAVLVFVLYARSPAAHLLYSNPPRLYLVAPVLLYWIGRKWRLVIRGSVDYDPVLFATKDKTTYLCITMVGLIMFAAKR